MSAAKEINCAVGPETRISPRGKGQGPTSFSERNIQSISVGVRGTEVLATTQTSDVNPGHGTNALIWGMT